MKIIKHVKWSSQIIILWCIFYGECLKGISFEEQGGECHQPTYAHRYKTH